MSQSTARIAEFKACMYCRGRVTESMVDLCDECFKERLKKHRDKFPRQTGRTTALLKRLVPGGNLFLLLRYENTARDLRNKYPDLKDHIHGPYTAKRIPVGRSDSQHNKWLVDHFVYESMDKELYDLLSWLEMADG